MSAPPAAVIAVMEAGEDEQVKDAREWRVLVAVASFADADGTNAWPSLASIARRAHMGKRTVPRYLEKLVAAGHLAVDYKAGPKGCNVYTVVAAARRAAAPDANDDVADMVATDVAETGGQVADMAATSRTSRPARGQIEHPRGQSGADTWPDAGGDVANNGGHQPDHPYGPGPPLAHLPVRGAAWTAPFGLDPAPEVVAGIGGEVEPEVVAEKPEPATVAELLEQHELDPSAPGVAALVDGRDAERVGSALGIVRDFHDDDAEAGLAGALRYLDAFAAGTRGRDALAAGREAAARHAEARGVRA